jgi:hypothetical protein
MQKNGCRRYIYWDLDDISFSGPLLGAAFKLSWRAYPCEDLAGSKRVAKTTNDHQIERAAN